MLPLIKDWNQAMLFPGFLALDLSIFGFATALRSGPATHSTRLGQDQETAWLYGSLAVLALWASLGPRAGLYTVFYALIPVFALLRAPEQTGIVVTLCFALFSAFAIRELGRRFPTRHSVIAMVGC